MSLLHKTAFLYVGKQSVGWLDEVDGLAQPFGNRSKPFSNKAKPADSEATNAKRNYLHSCLKDRQPELCAILLDTGCEAISLQQPRKTMETQPFYISVNPRQHRLRTAALTASLQQNRKPLDTTDHDDLSAISRLQNEQRKAGRWPGFRHRIPAVSRCVTCAGQTEVLQWQALLNEALDQSVEIYSYALLYEYFAQPLLYKLPAALLITRQPDQSVRHLFFDDTWLRFTRALPQQSVQPEADLQSSHTYITEHLQYDDNYSVLDVSVQDFDALGVSQDEYACRSVHQALTSALQQQKRDFHFGVRQEAVDRLNGWCLQTAAAKVEKLRLQRAGRIQAACVACLVLAVTASAFQIKKIAGLWNENQRVELQLQSLAVPADSSAAAEGADSSRLPAELFKDIVDHSGVLYRQSYAEPVAALLRLQEVFKGHPGLVVESVSWQWAQPEQESMHQLARRVARQSDTDRSAYDESFLPKLAALSEGQGLLVSIEGHLNISQPMDTTTASTSVAAYLSDYENFLVDIRQVFALSALTRVDYPFGSGPSVRLRSTSSKPESPVTVAVRDAMAFRRFVVEFSLDSALLTELLLEVSDLQAIPMEYQLSESV